MSERFFSAQLITGEHATLDGPEAHHLLHVMRAVPGQSVTLFDGSGAEFSAEIVNCGRANVNLRILERRDASRELPFELSIAVSLPKGDRQKWLVEKLSELGATELVPLMTERGVAQPTEGALERLRRTAIEAAKQCGRNRLMQIAKPQAWGDWICRKALDVEFCRLVAHPGGAPLLGLNRSAARPTHISIGPEGGFTDQEVADAIAAGWQTVDLGPRILRVETAAVALSAVVALSMRP